MKKHILVELYICALVVLVGCVTQRPTGYVEYYPDLDLDAERINSSVFVQTTFWNVLFLRSVEERRNELYRTALYKAKSVYGNNIELKDLTYEGKWSAKSLLLYFSIFGFVENASLRANIERPLQDQQAAQKAAERKRQLEEKSAEERKRRDQNISNLFYRTDNNVLKIGMSRAHVYHHLGYPLKINRSVHRWGDREQLIYENWRGRVLIYLENGVLTSWQTFP